MFRQPIAAAPLLFLAPRRLRWLTAAAGLLLAVGSAAAQAPGMLRPPQPADSGQWDGGFSFRVTFAANRVQFARTSTDLPGAHEVAPAYLGHVQPLFSVGFAGVAARKRGASRGGWEHRAVEYDLDGGTATVVLSRLSPAVLIDCPGGPITLGADESAGAAPTGVAFASGGSVVARRIDRDGALDVMLDEPWIVAWFGGHTPWRGYMTPVDVCDPIRGSDKSSLQERIPTAPLDLPLLIRVEHAPKRIERQANRVALRFDGAAGKVAIMPLFGGRLFEPAATERWIDAGVPQEVVTQARRWSRALRDYPLSVEETYAVDKKRGQLTVAQSFRWLSFEDDWQTPAVNAAPIPPMLAVALGGAAPVTFHRDGQVVEPVDYQLMDTPGKAMAIEGAGRYEYRISGLGSLLFAPPSTSPVVPDEATWAQRNLERHVRQMIDAGPLRPLFYVYGGIGSAPAYFYWADSAELAQAIYTASPYLSPALRESAKQYLRAEFRRNPPLQIDLAVYETGANRAPYDVPWDGMVRSRQAAESREVQRRTARMFGDLYGIHAYYRLTGQPPDIPRLRQRAQSMMDELLTRQDWALCGPIWRVTGGGFFQNSNYFNRNGQAKYNAWLAGAIGYTRLAQDLGWANDESAGWYAAGKWALARIAQARYTVEMHRMGLVSGAAEDDWRTLVHIDREGAIAMRGPVAAVVREDQELPPFIDLVPEVGALLGRHARRECGIYLDHLDRSMPLWYLSEAPKQSATEQRLCPLQHHQGNVLAQAWVLGKRGPALRRYVDTTRFLGDLYYLQNLSALLDSYATL